MALSLSLSLLLPILLSVSLSLSLSLSLCREVKYPLVFCRCNRLFWHGSQMNFLKRTTHKKLSLSFANGVQPVGLCLFASDLNTKHTRIVVLLQASILLNAIQPATPVPSHHCHPKRYVCRQAPRLHCSPLNHQ